MRAIPPPPPSSRLRAGPSADGRAELAERKASPDGGETGEQPLSQAPDSLVPVRIADLLDDPPPALGSRGRARKLTMPVIGAFIAGAVAVLVIENFPKHAGTPPSIVAAQPSAVADSERRSPAPTVESSAHAGVIAIPVAPSATAVDAVPSASTAASADGATLSSESPTASTSKTDREDRAPVPVASSSASATEPNTEQPVHRKLRKRRAAGSLAPEPPTAVFPD